MTPLAEFLQRREFVSSGELLVQIEEGLAHHSAGSGAAGLAHPCIGHPPSAKTARVRKRSWQVTAPCSCCARWVTKAP